MPRVARKNSQICFYHIIVQGINKEPIFEKEDYIKKYKNIILQNLRKSNVKILAYCIMNNHAHFLMHSEKTEDIGKYMQKVNTSYSNFYNKIKKRVGYVFRDRYYSQEILTQRQLYVCLKYIHNNPVKAKIVKNMWEYKYSSYTELFSNKGIIKKANLELLFQKGTDFKQQFEIIHKTKFTGEEELFWDIKEKNIKEFIMEIEEIYNKSIKELSKDKKILENIIKQARKETDVTLCELGEMLGVSKSTVSNYSKR